MRKMVFLAWLTKLTLLVAFVVVDAGNRQDKDGGMKAFVKTKTFLKNFLEDHELEVYAFKAGWYNDYIDMINKDYHKSSYRKDTIGFIILNTPDFFDKVLKSFVRKIVKEQGIDALDTLEPVRACMDYLVSEIQKGLAPMPVDYFSADVKVKETDKYFGVQAAGDVSGGVRYYRREDVVPDPWPQNKTIYGISIHPEFGGWFRFQGALFFPRLQYSGMLHVEPEDIVPTRDLRIELLEKATNFDEGWRNIIDVEKRYSEEQKRFFNWRTPKEDKIAMMRRWVEEGRF